MAEQAANVESYIARLRLYGGVPPAIQREVADILESLKSKLHETELKLAGEEAMRNELLSRLGDCELSLSVFDPGRSSEYWLRHSERVVETPD